MYANTLFFINQSQCEVAPCQSRGKKDKKYALPSVALISIQYAKFEDGLKGKEEKREKRSSLRFSFLFYFTHFKADAGKKAETVLQKQNGTRALPRWLPVNLPQSRLIKTCSNSMQYGGTHTNTEFFYFVFFSELFNYFATTPFRVPHCLCFIRIPFCTSFHFCADCGGGAHAMRDLRNKIVSTPFART